VPGAFSLAGSFSRYAPELVWIIIYMLPLTALFFWSEISLGTLRRFFQIMFVLASVIAAAGISAVLPINLPTDSCLYERGATQSSPGSLFGVLVPPVRPRGAVFGAPA